MTLLRRLVLPFFALAAGASLAAPPPAPGVYVMRHLQKDAGDDPGLSTEGRANAERLAGWFGTDAPRAIYVSSTRRARETAAPLARKLHIEPKEYAPADVAGLVARVRQESGTVLIVGHSNTVPVIVEALGGARPAAIPDDSFGDIWRVAPDGRTEKKSLGGR
ncbi:MAG TPA: phosphoglycerate mutase family protein [Allosphingosinicella sp.]|nr:phosphoglycerate mutase family protein [Allosphingosinicella sp.]